MGSLRTPILLHVLLVSMLLASGALAVDVGDEAPDFTLPSTTDTAISLSQFKGKKHVLIQFYTLDFAPTCTAGRKTRMADAKAFDTLNVQLLAISANDMFSQKTFAESLHVPYPLLSDHPDRTVIQRYGVLTRIDEAPQPVAQGAYFLIDKHGVIRGKWIKPPGVVFPNEPLLKAAQELEP